MRGLSSRKGTSEIIAALMMITITVAGAILLYVYSQGLMGRIQGEAVKQPYLEQLALDYYDWTGGVACGTGKLCLTLRNVGSANINLAAADYFINGQSVTAGTPTCASGYSASSLAPQGSCSVPLSAPAGVTSNLAYSVRIATNDGAVFTYSCIAGSFTR